MCFPKNVLFAAVFFPSPGSGAGGAGWDEAIIPGMRWEGCGVPGEPLDGGAAQGEGARAAAPAGVGRKTSASGGSCGPGNNFPAILPLN